MTRRGRAAITDGSGAFTVDPIDVDEPHRDEVLVAMKAAGLCHTDHDILASPVPVILGHEGAGVVEAVGDGVDDLRPGDRVALTWSMSCGACFQCVEGGSHLCERLAPLTGTAGHAHRGGSRRGEEDLYRAFNLGALSTLALVRREAVVPLPDSVPFTSAAIVGCAVMTGFGSAVNAAAVRPGSSVVVLGCGGVGLNVIQGARIAGASLIIGVDTNPSRTAMAERFGATAVLRPDQGDHTLAGAAASVRERTGGRGADFAFECTAIPELGAAPLAMIRNGGTAVQVSGIEQPVVVDMSLFEWDKVYINPLNGQCRPTRDFPRIFGLYAKGDLLLDELVTTTYGLDDLSRAFDDLLAGRNAKGVIRFE